MKFRNQHHQEMFTKAISNLDRQNYTLMAVVYLFTADNRLWSMTEKSICYSGVDFSRIQLRMTAEKKIKYFSVKLWSSQKQMASFLEEQEVYILFWWKNVYLV